MLIKTLHKSNFRVCDSVITDDGFKIPIVSGVLSETEVNTPNGYGYPSTFWSNVLSRKEVKDMILARECLGTIEHPEEQLEYEMTPYEKASHFVESVIIKDNNPYGRFGLLNTPKGNVIKALVDVGIPVGVSTRGLGEIRQDSRMPYVVEDGYELITWDFVRNPNFSNLRMSKVTDSQIVRQISELVNMYETRDAPKEDYHKENLIRDMNTLVSELRNVIRRVAF